MSNAIERYAAGESIRSISRDLPVTSQSLAEVFRNRGVPLRPRGQEYAGERHDKWKGDRAGDGAKRSRARRRYRLGPCERCGADGVHRHHRNRDVGDNSPGNIEILCAACHSDEHRAEREPAYAAMRKPVVPCINCGREKKRRGRRCSACAKYLRVNGIERPPRLWAYWQTR